MQDVKQLTDWQLIERCLQGDNRTWQLLYDRHHQTLRTIIWCRLGDEQYDSHLVEDIAQMVWLSLLRNDCDGLRRYRQERGCFKTYLRDMALQKIELHYRVKRRRLQAVWLDDHEPTDCRALNGLVLAQFAEYEESLTPQESRLLHERMLKDVPETTQAPFSAGNKRWLKHRMKRKWREHFDTT